MIITGMPHFESVCKRKLVKWYNKAFCEGETSEKIAVSNVFVVWSCKTLQNYRALLSTNVAGDGIYAVYTFSGDKEELYEDVFRKLGEDLKRADGLADGAEIAWP